MSFCLLTESARCEAAAEQGSIPVRFMAGQHPLSCELSQEELGEQFGHLHAGSPKWHSCKSDICGSGPMLLTVLHAGKRAESLTLRES